MIRAGECSERSTMERATRPGQGRGGGLRTTARRAAAKSLISLGTQSPRSHAGQCVHAGITMAGLAGAPHELQARRKLMSQLACQIAADGIHIEES